MAGDGEGVQRRTGVVQCSRWTLQLNPDPTGSLLHVHEAAVQTTQSCRTALDAARTRPRRVRDWRLRVRWRRSAVWFLVMRLRRWRHAWLMRLHRACAWPHATQSSSVGARDASELFLPRVVTVGSQTATWDVEHELLLTQAALARETELLEMACSMMSKHKVDAARARRRADELQARLDAAFASPGRVAEVATQASLGSATGAGRARRQRRRQSDLQHSDRASCVGVAIQTDARRTGGRQRRRASVAAQRGMTRGITMSHPALWVDTSERGRTDFETRPVKEYL